MTATQGTLAGSPHQSDMGLQARGPVLPFVLGAVCGGVVGTVVGTLLAERMTHLIIGMAGAVDRRGAARKEGEPRFDLLLQ